MIIAMSQQLHHQAMRKGTDKDWEQRAGCMTFPEAVAKAGVSLVVQLLTMDSVG